MKWCGTGYKFSGTGDKENCLLNKECFVLDAFKGHSSVHVGSVINAVNTDFMVVSGRMSS